MENIRELFRMTGRSIDQDREIDTFSQPEAAEVSWLNADPQTAEEIAENLYERMRAIGVSFEANQGEIDGISLMGAYLARKGAQGEDTL